MREERVTITGVNTEGDGLWAAQKGLTWGWRSTRFCKVPSRPAESHTSEEGRGRTRVFTQVCFLRGGGGMREKRQQPGKIGSSSLKSGEARLSVEWEILLYDYVTDCVIEGGGSVWASHVVES